VFESAQGVLLDQLHGFYPHVTKSDTTFRLALELLDSAGFNGERTKVGLLRGYSTRHGAGPFVSEDTSLNLPACHNAENEWQGRFRLGWFDVVAARYALRVVGGVDCLAITNLDRMSGLKEVKICTLYNSPNDEFFTRGDLRVLVNPSVEDLARRTQMMKECKPFFDVTEGWQDTNSVTGYLQILGHLLQREVDAISVSDTAAGKRVFAREVITQ
jgi:adenylosuccinate synthase